MPKMITVKSYSCICIEKVFASITIFYLFVHDMPIILEGYQ